jgi:hypothetical protein
MSDDSEINLEYFKSTIKQYIKIDTEIKALTNAIRQRREKLNGLKQILSTYLKNHDIENIELQGSYKGKEIIHYEHTRTLSANSNVILKILNDKLKDNPELLESINTELEKHKKKKTNQTVKIKKKAKKKAKIIPSINESNLSNNLLLNT